MTDRFFALTVALDKDIREDDAQPIIAAIKMLRGVASVEPHVADLEFYTAYERARVDLVGKLWEVLKANHSMFSP